MKISIGDIIANGLLGDYVPENPTVPEPKKIGLRNKNIKTNNPIHNMGNCNCGCCQPNTMQNNSYSEPIMNNNSFYDQMVFGNQFYNQPMNNNEYGFNPFMNNSYQQPFVNYNQQPFYMGYQSQPYETNIQYQPQQQINMVYDPQPYFDTDKDNDKSNTNNNSESTVSNQQQPNVSYNPYVDMMNQMNAMNNSYENNTFVNSYNPYVDVMNQLNQMNAMNNTYGNNNPFVVNQFQQQQMNGFQPTYQQPQMNGFQPTYQQPQQQFMNNFQPIFQPMPYMVNNRPIVVGKMPPPPKDYVPNPHVMEMMNRHQQEENYKEYRKNHPFGGDYNDPFPHLRQRQQQGWGFNQPGMNNNYNDFKNHLNNIPINSFSGNWEDNTITHNGFMSFGNPNDNIYKVANDEFEKITPNIKNMMMAMHTPLNKNYAIDNITDILTLKGNIISGYHGETIDRNKIYDKIHELFYPQTTMIDPYEGMSAEQRKNEEDWQKCLQATNSYNQPETISLKTAAVRAEINRQRQGLEGHSLYQFLNDDLWKLERDEWERNNLLRFEDRMLNKTYNSNHYLEMLKAHRMNLIMQGYIEADPEYDYGSVYSEDDHPKFVVDPVTGRKSIKFPSVPKYLHSEEIEKRRHEWTDMVINGKYKEAAQAMGITYDKENGLLRNGKPYV